MSLEVKRKLNVEEAVRSRYSEAAKQQGGCC